MRTHTGLQAHSRRSGLEPPHPAPKKWFGQHFLTAEHYARRIAEAVPARPGEPVLEIGPGAGALTVHLARRFPGMQCVERDPELLPLLRSNTAGLRLTIHCADALDFDFTTAGFPLHVAGNLPYSVGALLIRKTLGYGNRIASCTFMVQREVAERIAASPGTKQNGWLTMFCRFFGTPRILFHVPPGAFSPPPKVESSVFQLIPDKDLERKLPYAEWEALFALIDAGFSMRRKMLATVLRMKSIGAGIPGAFAAAGIDAKARAEELDIGQWLRLYKEMGR